LRAGKPERYITNVGAPPWSPAHALPIFGNVSASSPKPPDWSMGHYEHTAAQLLPAARMVVDRAGICDGERVLDVGCGTGNAALLAAALGARVTGVDPAARLLEVARERVASEGLNATFESGDAAALPVEDGAADVVMSVFGVIFAPDPVAAAEEMARVATPDGRILLSAWIPEGPISQMGRAAREAIGKALGPAPAGPPPFMWHDQDALAGLFAPYGFDVSLERERIAFEAPSLDEYLDGEFDNHPLSVAGRALLEPRGEADALRARAREILAEGNESPDAFRVTSSYVVVTARRG
jgi:SAM-dependent methyltransferase